MHKIARNCAILLQNKILTQTSTQSLAMTITLTPDPNSNPSSINIPQLYSAFYPSPLVLTTSMEHTDHWVGTFNGRRRKRRLESVRRTEHIIMNKSIVNLSLAFVSELQPGDKKQSYDNDHTLQKQSNIKNCVQHSLTLNSRPNSVTDVISYK